MLLIYANKLGGIVEIINGLNHYIGMQTIHTENFIEFSVLRYIFGFIALMILLVAVIGRKKGLYILFAGFLIFGVIAMADFYRWNYNYGHDLDPNAAIKVPGMAYQPPLIGYKQLLNFGAYSIPDTGGLFMIAAGLLMLLAILLERKLLAKWFKRKKVTTAALLAGAIAIFMSCGVSGPKPVKLNQDMCAYCRMTITEASFAAQLTTKKGRHYMFDDILCLMGYKKENEQMEYEHFYVADFCSPDYFVQLDQAVLLQSDSLRSPMGGNIAGFAVPDSALHYKSRFGALEVSWTELIR
jgi:copper chaperone NosL